MYFEYANLLVALFFLGFVMAPLGTVAVRKFGGATTFGAAVGLTGLLTCFTPTLLYWRYSVLLMIQILVGALQVPTTRDIYSEIII